MRTVSFETFRRPSRRLPAAGSAARVCFLGFESSRSIHSMIAMMMRRSVFDEPYVQHVGEESPLKFVVKVFQEAVRVTFNA